MGLKKLGNWLKKNIKPIATVAAVVFPPLAPAIGAALGATGTAAAIVGSAALGAGASVIAGDKPADVLKSAAVGGAAAGVVNAVAPDFFTSSGLLGTSTAPAAATGDAATGLMGSALPPTAGTGAAMADTGIFDKLAGYGSGVLDFAKANPSLAGSLLGALGGAVSAANTPKETTTTTSIDPAIKAEYLANLNLAKSTAANLGPREFVQPGALYTEAERNLYNLGMTPFGAADIEAFYNPYEEQVVEGALGDIERSRQMQDVTDRARAIQAKAFGGSRQGVQSALTNEAALRTAASTASGLRSAGFNTAANLGLSARPLNMTGLTTSLDLASRRDARRQAELDAIRNAPLERLAITGGALGLQPANTGGTSTQPLYSSTVGSALSGGLTGAYIGSLLQPKPQPVP